MALPAKQTTPNEISSIIKTLKTNKSPVHDQISNKIVKNIPAKQGRPQGGQVEASAPLGFFMDQLS
jgi:hypothetical protein